MINIRVQLAFIMMNILRI